MLLNIEDCSNEVRVMTDNAQVYKDVIKDLIGEAREIIKCIIDSPTITTQIILQQFFVLELLKVVGIK
jgi:hypothetical protein